MDDGSPCTFYRFDVFEGNRLEQFHEDKAQLAGERRITFTAWARDLLVVPNWAKLSGVGLIVDILSRDSRADGG